MFHHSLKVFLAPESGRASTPRSRPRRGFTPQLFDLEARIALSVFTEPTPDQSNINPFIFTSTINGEIDGYFVAENVQKGSVTLDGDTYDMMLNPNWKSGFTVTWQVSGAPSSTTSTNVVPPEFDLFITEFNSSNFKIGINSLSLTDSGSVSLTFPNASGQSLGYLELDAESTASYSVPVSGNLTYSIVVTPGVTPAPTPNVTLASSVNPSTYGQSVTFTATVSPASSGLPTPTGSVQFAIDGSNYQNPVTLGNNGTASVSDAALPVKGSPHKVSATYIPAATANFTTSTSTLIGGQTINKAIPTVKVSDAGGTANGTAFPATATVAGVIAGVDNKPAASLESVSPTLSYYAGSTASDNQLPGAPSAAGTYTVVANFPGSADYTSASDKTTFVIGAPTPPSSEIVFSSFIRSTNDQNMPGVQLTYKALNYDFDTHVSILLYWSSSPAYSDRIGSPTYTITDAQNYGQVFVSRQSLGNVPYGARYLVAAVDNGGTLATISVQLFHTLTIQDVEAIIPPPNPNSSKYKNNKTRFKKDVSTYNILSNALVVYLNSQEGFEQYQINYPERQAAFIGQVAVETAYLTNPREAGNASKWKGRGLLQLTSRPNYQAFARYYAFNEFNSPLYQNLKIPIMTDPDQLAANPILGAEAAGWYWHLTTGRNLNTYADQLSYQSLQDLSANNVIVTISQLIRNGHPSGYVPDLARNRIAYTRAAFFLLEGKLS